MRDDSLQRVRCSGGDAAGSSSVKVWTPRVCVMVTEPAAPYPADKNMGKTKIKCIKGSQRLQNSCDGAGGLQGPVEQEGLSESSCWGV